MTASALTPGPLAGRRVLDLSNELGQLGARFLADLGADVIKVEPREGDPVRALGPFFRGEPGDDHSLAWWTLNAGKRSVTCDIRRERGRELCLALAAASDVVILAAGRSKAVALSASDITTGSPQAVVVTVSAFPPGPSADWLVTELVAAAAGGLMDRPSADGEPPIRSTVPRALTQVNLQAALAALAGLVERERTGRTPAPAYVSAVEAARAAAAASSSGSTPPADPAGPAWTIDQRPGGSGAWPRLHNDALGESFAWPPPPWSWAGHPGPQRAPQVGEHNAEVYGSVLALDAGELRGLRARMVI